MTKIFIPMLLGLFILNVPAVFAGGENGNGSPVTTLASADSGEPIIVEALSLYQARTVDHIDIGVVETESEAINRTVGLLEEIDPQFLMYFIDELSFVQNPEKVRHGVFHGSISGCEGGGDEVSDASPSWGSVNQVTQASEFTDRSEFMQVYPIYDSPALGPTSRAAIQIQGAIYLVTRTLLPSGDTALADKLSIQLMAEKTNREKIRDLTEEVLSAELRSILF